MTDNLERIRKVLRDSLQIGDRADELTEHSRLLGGIPEFDSVAVVGVVMALEEEYGLKISDRELSAELFETMGSLTHFISVKSDSSASHTTGSARRR
jgi:acyl carrier protein